ncbi:MAG: hypothetical protein ACREC6_06815, partial [Hyphomicrobiaceae bacterium]
MKRRLKQLVRAMLFKERPRRYIPLDLSLERFLSRLNDAGCRYIVLRWFEGFPRIVDGDIDILVHDEDVEAVRSFLRPMTVVAALAGKYPPSRKCDVYSVSGLPGSTYKGLAYYPAHLAARLLARAERHPSGAMVPCKEDHFFSLAFHALYHKGLLSGLPTSNTTLLPNPAPRHDYAGRLK